MKKIFGLALLPVLAIGIGSLVNVKAVKAALAEKDPEPVPVVALKTAYEHTFDNLPDGSVTPQQLFDDGLYWAREDVDLSTRVATINGQQNKLLDMMIVGTDAGQYGRLIGIGSDGGLKNLDAGRAYELSMYLDVSQVTSSTSRLFVELSVKNEWTGVIIKNDGSIVPCDPNGGWVTNYSFIDNTLKMSFISKLESVDAGVRPYFKLTMEKAENSDIVTIGNLSIKEAATYASNFEGYAIGTAAPMDSPSNIANIYNANLDYVKVDGDEDGHYLHIKHNNDSDENVWKHFYFNRLYNLNSGHTYRLQMNVFEHNFAEMYVKYHDTSDNGTNTFLPNGTIASWSNPSTYLTNAVWDGEFLSQDILFVSSKDPNWWPQCAIQFCVPAHTELDVKIDYFDLYDISDLGATKIKVSGADSFVLGEEYSQKDLSVKYLRDEEEVEAGLVIVNSSAYNKDEIGSYKIDVVVGDGSFWLNANYQASVHNNVDSISMKSNPTKVAYEYNEELDVTGAKIDVVKENGDSSTVDVTLDMVTGYNKQTYGEQTLTVTYEGKTTTFTVEIIDKATSISMKSNPSKTQYQYGEELDLTGAVLVVNKSSGATEDVNVIASMISNYNKNQLGEQTVTVTYETFTTTFKVEVVDYIASISMKSNPSKLTYTSEEELDLTGAVILVTNASGATKEINVTSDMISGFTKGKVGEQTITVTYEGKTVTFKVTVNSPATPDEPQPEPQKKGCGGSVVAASAIISIISLTGFGLLAIRKKED